MKPILIVVCTIAVIEAWMILLTMGAWMLLRG